MGEPENPSFLWFRDFRTCPWAPTPILFIFGGPRRPQKTQEKPKPFLNIIFKYMNLKSCKCWKIGCSDILKIWNLKNSKLWNFETLKLWSFHFQVREFPYPLNTDSHPHTCPPLGEYSWRSNSREVRVKYVVLLSARQIRVVSHRILFGCPSGWIRIGCLWVWPGSTKRQNS